MRVLVAGGSGLIGREVISLVKKGGFHVRTLSRNHERAQALKSVADDVRIADATRACSTLDSRAIEITRVGRRELQRQLDLTL